MKRINVKHIYIFSWKYLLIEDSRHSLSTVWVHWINVYFDLNWFDLTSARQNKLMLLVNFVTDLIENRLSSFPFRSWPILLRENGSNFLHYIHSLLVSLWLSKSDITIQPFNTASDISAFTHQPKKKIACRISV